MKVPDVCPYCGSAQGEVARGGANEKQRTVDMLFQEIDRIREMAERRTGGTDQQIIERLSREVMQLRETVARLRGTAATRSC